MIIGGSFISTGQLCSKYARYQFRPHFFQHATFRIVQSIVDTAEYNTERWAETAAISLHTSVTVDILCPS
jgi:hypothetical protein